MRAVFIEHSEWEKDILTMLESPRGAEREMAIEVLQSWGSDNYQTSLSLALKTEKTKKIRTMLQSILNISGQNDAEQNAAEWTLEKLVQETLTGAWKRKLSATGLIWGVYEDKNLLNTFRYMEDGTFNTVDAEEYILPEGARIGLVHPVELSEETLLAWKEQMSDYEIVQPIEQLERLVFRVTEKDSVNCNKVCAKIPVPQHFAAFHRSGMRIP